MSYFKLSEFTCKCGCGENRIDSHFVTLLEELRHKYGKPLIVNSGYRCPEYNNEVSETGMDGPHTTGRAVDLGIDGPEAFRLLKVAMDLGYFTGVGIKQKGKSRFIHLDNLLNLVGSPRPRVWSY